MADALHPAIAHVLGLLRARLPAGTLEVLECWEPDACMVTLGICGPPTGPPVVLATVSGFGRREGRCDLDLEWDPQATCIIGNPGSLPVSINDLPFDDLVARLAKYQRAADPLRP